MLYQHISELIGETPLLHLKSFSNNPDIAFYAKLEHFNPGGSVKDRIGLSMIAAAEAQGLLQAGSTIIDATAGNTGIGIALAALEKNYSLVFTVPEKFSAEKITLLRALGAKVILTPESEGMTGALALADTLRRDTPGAISLQQFENPANPGCHYDHTGPEIWADLEGHVDVLVAGAGSGGTVSGVSRYLKDQRQNLLTFVADPLGSTMGGGPEGPYKIEGIGNHFIPATMDLSVIDGFITVTDEEAFHYVKELARKEGLVVGSSSGAALAAAIKASERIPRGNIVVIFPDRGDRYFSKQLYE